MMHTLFCFVFPRPVLALQSYWSLSCDHGLDFLAMIQSESNKNNSNVCFCPVHDEGSFCEELRPTAAVGERMTTRA